MKYTFEITISGCSTHCAHCYVNGGPAPSMSLDNFRFCAKRLRPVLDRLAGSISVTLGNEMFCHPQIADILQICKEWLSPYVSFRDFIPTTGLALLSKKDLPVVLERLRALDASGFMLALHGDRCNHNHVTQNRNAYDGLFHAAGILHDYGFKLLWNLIVSNLLAEDIQAVLTQISPYGSKSRLTVPLYVPTARMYQFQSLRADHNACMKIAHIAAQNGVAADSLIRHCAEHSEFAVLRNINKHGFHLQEEIKQSPNWIFFNITQNLDFYYGNVGAHTQYWGNLRNLQEEALQSAIAISHPNYDWTAFYEASIWETLTDHILPLCPGTRNLVYPSKADCLYALLDALKIPNKLIP